MRKQQAASSKDDPGLDSLIPRFPVFPISFLLLYLLLPPILILILSYNTPKFNARYVMVSHPALLLLLAGGLAALWERRGGPLGNVLRGALSGLALLFLVSASAYADWNAYNRPDFARADFRGVARYLGAAYGARRDGHPRLGPHLSRL